jgi:hypothetical protein
MKNANFTNLRTLFIAVIALFATAANAQLACNDNVQVSVDPTLDFNCNVELSADAILEGDASGTYDMQVTTLNGSVIYDGAAPADFDANAYLGETLKVMVIEGTNSCWGTIVVEDKVAPACDNVANPSISCDDVIPVIVPTFVDNCTANEDMNIQLINETTDESNFCSTGTVITRTYAATDASGNTSTVNCVQTITITQNAIVLPSVLSVDCGSQSFEEFLQDATDFVEDQITDACMFSVNYTDVPFEGCGGLQKVSRTWAVLNMCTGDVQNTTQLFQEVDNVAPSITYANVTVSANVPASHPNPCLSTAVIPMNADVSDCTAIESVQYFTDAGEIVNGAIPAPGLPIGNHTLTITAVDACGNVGTTTATITVEDGIAPTPVCKEITQVSLTSNGEAVVAAASFDNGSYDNCCLDYIEVRRMDSDEPFGPTVTFNCEDETVEVILRAVDCNELDNSCMVVALVEDKIGPSCTAPSDVNGVDCDFYYTDLAPALENEDYSVLEQYGIGTTADNCSLISAYEVTYTVDQCGNGKITRKWTANDAAENQTAVCTQEIEIEHESNWTVEFSDVEEITVDCADAEIDVIAPVITNDECEMIATSYTDTQFDVVGSDHCMKIFRDWTVINWCEYNPGHDEAFPQNDSTPLKGDIEDDYYATYTQVIKVIDNTAPEVTTADALVVSEDADACHTDIAVADVEALFGLADNCGDVEDYHNFGDLEPYLNNTGTTFVNVPVGTYEVSRTSVDACGNAGTAVNTVTVEPKAPTAYCTDNLVIDLMVAGMATVNAADFNFASSDNCSATADLSYAFSSDINNTEMTVDCDNLGDNTVEMWVFDTDGQTDYCVVTLTVQNNNGADCGTGTLTVTGAVNTESANAVNGVTVEINGGLFSAVTSADGTYEITGLAQGTDITVAPSLDDAITNGVTTFDIVKITRHILGIEELDSAYKMIAADANNTATITTLDIVAIRKAILQIETAFPNNTSWRFVDANQVMNSDNPFAFAEVININNIDANIDANFIAIKVGDVTGDANVSFNAADDRSVISINAEDKAVKAGETVAVEFTTDATLAGYQFTLNFAGLELVDLEYGVAIEENFGTADVAAGVLTTSWNASKAVNLEGESLFTAVFVATEDVQLSSALAINSKVTAAEAVTAEFNTSNVALAFNGAAANSFAVYQNTPNPFSAETVIGFNAVEAGNATVTFTSVEGKVLAVRTVEATKGYNAITVNAANIAATGVVYYTVETANNTATNKMVIVK